MCIKVTTDDGSVISRQVQLDVVTPEALILGKEEYHIQQVPGVHLNIFKEILVKAVLKTKYMPTF